MSVITLIPFEAWHYLTMDLRPEDRLLVGTSGFMDGIIDAEKNGQAFTAIENDQIIGVGGIKKYWNGVGEAWAVYPQDVAKYGRDIFRITKRGLEEIESKYGYRRVQAVARKDWQIAVNFLLALRFRVDGLMEKYGPDGSDYYLMSRVH